MRLKQRTTFNKICVLALTAVAVSAIARAGINQWSSLGPDGGGAVALVLDPQTSSTIYALTSGGIFKSTDAGANWHATGALPPADVPGDTPQSLVIDPRNPGILYTARQSGGALKSIDAGATWTAVNSGLLSPPPGVCTIDPSQAVCQAVPQAARVSDLSIDPQTDTVYAATGYGGIFKSANGGTSWSAVNSGLAMNGVPYLSVTIDPQNPRTLYTGSGVGPFKSTDGGASWIAMKSGLPLTCLGFPRVVVNPRDSTTLFYADCNGLFKSTDGGASWSPSGSGLPQTSGPSSFLAFDPQNSNVVYAAAFSGVFKSVDAGATWNLTNSGITAAGVNVVVADPKSPGTVYAAANFPYSAGVFKSTDGATSWSPISSGLSAVRITAVAVDPQNPATLYASAPGSVIKSTDRGANWSPLSVTYLWAIAPRISGVLYAGGPDGLLKSSDGGMSWIPAQPGAPENSCRGVTALAIDPQDTSNLYAAVSRNGCSTSTGSGLYKSLDGGVSWAILDADPTSGRVRGLAIDPQTSGVIYVWSGRGLFKSADAGASWNLLKDFRNINAVAIDPQDSNTTYVSSSGVFKSAMEEPPGAKSMPGSPRSTSIPHTSTRCRAWRLTCAAPAPSMRARAPESFAA